MLVPREEISQTSWLKSVRSLPEACTGHWYTLCPADLSPHERRERHGAMSGSAQGAPGGEHEALVPLVKTEAVGRRSRVHHQLPHGGLRERWERSLVRGLLLDGLNQCRWLTSARSDMRAVQPSKIYRSINNTK